MVNGDDGVRIHVEGAVEALDSFVAELQRSPPPAARVMALDCAPVAVEGLREFAIRASEGAGRPTVRISPDLALCDACRRELFDSADRRCGYPYINCTDCGPRYSILEGLPYDRPLTTMREWPMCEACAREYRDPGDRRFHAQPVACPDCGPRFLLERDGRPAISGRAAIAEAARLLATGEILAAKGIGGFHLACDARDRGAVAALRTRKFRKEKPFAVMARDLAEARSLVELSAAAEAALTSPARPIVLAAARRELPEVAPGNPDLGIMLPYAPLHELLFADGAPPALVMTSANRSSEPIAYRDEEARERLRELADAFLIGERPIARRIDDSVVRVGRAGPVLLRRARGYAPSAAGRLPLDRPVLAVGADLKNTITLVVGGEAFVSQYLGDLEHFDAFEAFRSAARDLVAMYELEPDALTVMHDRHPEYASTRFALEAPGRAKHAVQHHRAHVASVLAEREAWDRRALGIAFDGTGYGDDGSIWGGELFAGSIRDGFERVGHLRPAPLPGGDAAARHPVQAAAGFLSELGSLPDLSAAPFGFPPRFAEARQLVEKGVRLFQTTSAGRLFDTVAAIAGFVRPMTFEGQAAIWLEHLARSYPVAEGYPVPFEAGELDYRPALRRALEARARGDDPGAIAAAFHRGLARGIRDAAAVLCETHALDTVALSGGVFQNRLLLESVTESLEALRLEVWINRSVPPNDGGISFGQAALALSYESRP